MKSNRFWITVLGIVAAVSLVAILLIGNAQGGVFQSPQSGTAHIYSNGHLIESIDLNAVTEPRTIVVSSERGENIVEVEMRRIRVADADCRDGFCVNQGWISGGIMPIVCLPNGLIIQIEGEGVSDESGDTRNASDRIDGIVG